MRFIYSSNDLHLVTAWLFTCVMVLSVYVMMRKGFHHHAFCFVLFCFVFFFVFLFVCFLLFFLFFFIVLFFVFFLFIYFFIYLFFFFFYVWWSRIRHWWSRIRHCTFVITSFGNIHL